MPGCSLEYEQAESTPGVGALVDETGLAARSHTLGADRTTTEILTWETDDPLAMARRNRGGRPGEASSVNRS